MVVGGRYDDETGELIDDVVQLNCCGVGDVSSDILGGRGSDEMERICEGRVIIGC